MISPEESQFNKIWRAFTDYLIHHQMHASEGRRAVIRIIASLDGCFTASELLHEAQDGATKGKISRITVYRTLAECVDAGLLQKVDSAESGKYELIA